MGSDDLGTRSNAGWLTILAAVVLGGAPGAAMAQALSCAVPAQVAAPHADLPSPAQPQRLLPIGGYTLAVTWSPEYCRGKQRSPRDAFQCGGPRPKFGFTLHGLWPDGVGSEWPQYCRATTLLPPPVIRRNLCATPSPQLLQHEWAKHGTCMTTRPADYFQRSTRLYAGLRYPNMTALSRAPLTVVGLARAFAAVNPGMQPNMLRVTATRNGWLDEIWFCLSKAYRPVACPVTKDGIAPGAALKIWRGGGRESGVR